MTNNLYEESYPDFICTGCEILLSDINGAICPICGSDIVPCDRCVSCGDFYGYDELSNGFCKNCDEALEKRA